MSKTVVTTDPANQLIQGLVTETYKLIESQAGSPEKAKKLATMFVAKFVAQVVFKALTEAPPEACDTKEKIAAHTVQNFGKIKFSFQEAVSAGFSSAMSSFTGNRIDYYCQVKIVGPDANKEPI